MATEIQSENDSKFGLMWAISVSIKDSIQKLHGWEELIIELIRGIEEKNVPHFLMLNKLSFAEARLNIKLALFCKELIKEKGLPKNRILKLISSIEYLPGDAKQEAAERFIRLSDKKAVLEALKALDLEEPNNKKSQEFSDKKHP